LRNQGLRCAKAKMLLYRRAKFVFNTFFGLFRLFSFCFVSIERPKLPDSIFNRSKRLVSDSVETSFGSSFGCFKSKLVFLGGTNVNSAKLYSML
jgi:hypothetical protein